MTLRRLVPCVVALAALALPAAAAASFPGRNGDLAVASPFGEVRHVVEIDPRTGDKDWLTQPFAGLGGRRETFAPQYFPDGRRFLFVRSTPESSWSVWSAAAEGGDPIQHAGSLAVRRGMNAAALSLSPDGTRIVYERFGGIFTSRLDAGDERVLRRERRCTRPDGTVDVPECDFTTDPVWSPDGRWITVVRSGGAVAADESGLWLMDARDGRLVRRLARSGYGADWSPDSRRIVYGGVSAGTAAPGGLYSVRVDGTGPRRLTRGRRSTHAEPVWSPNGRWLAWVRIRYSGDPVEDVDGIHLSVWRRRIAGGRAERIAKLPEPYEDEGFFEAPTLSWQPRP